MKRTIQIMLIVGVLTYAVGACLGQDLFEGTCRKHGNVPMFPPA